MLLRYNVQHYKVEALSLMAVCIVAYRIPHIPGTPVRMSANL